MASPQVAIVIGLLVWHTDTSRRVGDCGEFARQECLTRCKKWKSQPISSDLNCSSRNVTLKVESCAVTSPLNAPPALSKNDVPPRQPFPFAIMSHNFPPSARAPCQQSLPAYKNPTSPSFSTFGTSTFLLSNFLQQPSGRPPLRRRRDPSLSLSPVHFIHW